MNGYFRIAAVLAVSGWPAFSRAHRRPCWLLNVALVFTVDGDRGHLRRRYAESIIGDSLAYGAPT